MEQNQKWVMALLPFERGYMLGYFHAKQEEGRYLSDVGIKDLSQEEIKKLAVKAFDIKTSKNWKHRNPKRRFCGRAVDNSKTDSSNAL